MYSGHSIVQAFLEKASNFLAFGKPTLHITVGCITCFIYERSYAVSVRSDRQTTGACIL